MGEVCLSMKITCAQCDKLVDRWEVSERVNVMATQVKVWCHGDTDVCVISDRQIMEAGPDQDWTTGTAFQTKRVEPPHAVLGAS